MRPPLRRLSAALVLAAAFVFMASGTMRAQGIYPDGATGADLTWFDCGMPFPSSPQSFGIISVSGGRAFYANACLLSEYAWARVAPAPVSFILNLNSPVGSVAFEAETGPKGTCAANDDLCRAYNFGYNAARLAVAFVSSQEVSGSMWWLDVETDNSWSTDVATNDQVIQGAIDYLRAQGAPVGIYSTPTQWSQLAGSFSPALPDWVAGALDATSAPGYCAPSQAFGGGSVWLVQYTAADYNSDYACPAVPSGG